MKVDFEKAVKSGVERAMQEFYKMHYDQTIKTAKSEAVKEFAERLEEYSYESMGNYGISRMVVSVKDIDNLVKEMVGEKE